MKKDKGRRRGGKEEGEKGKKGKRMDMQKG